MWPRYSDRSKDFANGAAKDLENAASAMGLRRKRITAMGGTGIKVATVGCRFSTIAPDRKQPRVNAWPPLQRAAEFNLDTL